MVVMVCLTLLVLWRVWVCNFYFHFVLLLNELFDMELCAVYIGQAPFFYVVKQKYTTANIVIYSDISYFYYQKMAYITTVNLKSSDLFCLFRRSGTF